MKINLTKIFALSILLVLITGCGQPSIKDDCKKDGQYAPMWACKPSYKNSSVSLGIKEKDKNIDMQTQEDGAILDGNKKLKKLLNQKLTDIFTKLHNNQDINQKKVTKSITSILEKINKKSKVVVSWKSDVRTLYLLTGVKNRTIVNLIKKELTTNYGKNSKILKEFNKYKKDNKFQELLEVKMEE